MKFTVKSAGQYSNVLSEMISSFSFKGYDEVADGLVKVTEISEKSKIVTGKPELIYEDEQKEIKPTNKVAQIDPMVRVQILKDLVAEKNKIDYEISKQKQNLTILSPISGEEINVDLATKENTLYRKTIMKNLENLFGVEDENLEMSKRINLFIDGQSMVFEYPVITKRTSLVNESEVNEMYAEFHKKTQEASDLIDTALSSTSFEFENKFPLFKSVDKVIKMYK